MSVKLTTVIKQHLSGYDQSGNAVLKSNTRYKISKINIIPNFDPSIVMTDSSYLSRIDTTYFKGLNIIFEGDNANVRSNVLRQTIPIYPNTYYNSKVVDQAYKNLMSIGYFKSAKISFKESAGVGSAVDTTQYITERVDTTLVYRSPTSEISCNILCTPALRQGLKLEVEGSTTSSFYGLSLTAGYQNRNIFRGAEAFDISMTTGNEYMKSQESVKRKSTEIGMTTSLSFPRFILPNFAQRFPQITQPRTKIGLSINMQDRPYYKRTLTGASWNYSWRTKGYSSFDINTININIIDISERDEDFFNSLTNEYLRNSYETQLIAGLSLSYTYNNQFKNITGNATMLRVNFETSGNLIDGLGHLLSSPATEDGVYHVLSIPYAQYIRSDINISRKIKLGEKSAIAGRFYAGAGYAYGNSKSLPYDRFFYAGGSNSMRGWSPRTLGPGSSPEKSEDQIFPNQVGDMKLEANLELRFPIWENIHGATFFDLGNIWYLKKNQAEALPSEIFHIGSFYKQLGLNTGLGIRLDIQFAILRLDWGVQLHNPNLPIGERWIDRFDWDNTALNFGVGYPF